MEAWNRTAYAMTSCTYRAHLLASTTSLSPARSAVSPSTKPLRKTSTIRCEMSSEVSPHGYSATSPPIACSGG